jgi:hypothetical protein
MKPADNTFDKHRSRATLAPEMLVSAIRCPAGDSKAICREGAQVLAAAIVIHGQHAELAGGTKRVRHKIQRPR